MSTITDSLADVQALTFDVFGTVVDWHGSVSKALRVKASESEYTKDLLTDKGITIFIVLIICGNFIINCRCI